MRKSNCLWRGIAVGGLSLALVGGVGLPISAQAAGKTGSEKSCNMTEHRQAMKAMHQKMLRQAKAEDAALEKLVAEMNKAPEAKKPDLEAAILTKLVAMHHKRLNEWESMQAHMMQWRKERMQASTTATSGCGMCKGMMGKGTSTAQN